MKYALRLLSALAFPAALGLAGAALADPMAADHPMSAAPMAADHPMADSPMATDAMAKPKPKMKHHPKKASPATGAMGSDAMAAPASTNAMAGH